MEQESKVDFSQLNRDINLFGKTNIDKLKKQSIFVYGLRSLGVEIILNLLHFQPSQLTIFDDNEVNLQDVGSCTVYQLSDCDKRIRQDVCLQYFKQINNKLTIKKASQIENISQIINSEFLHEFSLVIITELFDFQKLHEIDQICRSKKSPVGFIYAGSLGLYSFLFSDFGEGFKVSDRDGEETQRYFIEKITQSDPGVVHIYKDKPHKYKDGDFVKIEEVEGMKEVNGFEARPIRVIDQYSFQIEETSDFQAYNKNGFVQTIKVPFRLNFKSFEQFMNNPEFNREIYKTQEQLEHVQQLHIVLLGIFQYYDKFKQLPDIKNENHAKIFLEQCQEILKNHQNNNEQQSSLKNTSDLKNKLITNIAKYLKTNFAPVSIYMGSQVAKEVVSFTGKYSPIQSIIHNDLTDLLSSEEYDDKKGSNKMQQQNENQQSEEENDEQEEEEEEEETQEEQQGYANTQYQDMEYLFGRKLINKIRKQKIAIVGAGANGCEILRNLILLGAATNPQGQIYLIDDAQIKSYNVNIHQWLDHQHMDKQKAVVVCDKVRQLDNTINIQPFLCKASLKNEDVLNEEFWNGLNLVFNSSDRKECKHYLHNKAIWYEKPLFDQNLHGLKANTQIVIPQMTAASTEMEGFVNYGIYTQDKECINNFPYEPTHNVIWAKEQFSFFFIETFKDLNSLKENPNLFLTIQRNSIKINARSRLKLLILRDLILNIKQIDIEHIIILSKEIFDLLFNTKIKQLLDKYPADKEENEKKFWIGYKRLPKPIEYDIEKFQSLYNSHLIMNFITICTILLSNIFQKEFKIQEKSEYIENVLQQNYAKKQRPKYFHLEEELSDQQVEIVLQKLTDQSNINQYNYNIKNFNLDADNMRNWYMEFLEISSNLRADCYDIKRALRHQVETIVNEVDRTCPLTQSIIASQLCFQYIKLLQGKKKSQFRQADIDMAINKYDIFEPNGPEQIQSDENKQMLIPPNFTVWDKIRIYGPQTIETLVNNFREREQINIKSIKIEGQLIWDEDQDNQDQIQQKTPVELYYDLINQKQKTQKESIELQLNAFTDDDKECIFAKIRYTISDDK